MSDWKHCDLIDVLTCRKFIEDLSHFSSVFFPSSFYPQCFVISFMQNSTFLSLLFNLRDDLTFFFHVAFILAEKQRGSQFKKYEINLPKPQSLEKYVYFLLDNIFYNLFHSMTFDSFDAHSPGTFIFLHIKSCSTGYIA